MKKYKVILHQEYIVEAETEQAAIDKAEQFGLGNEYEIGLATTVQEIEKEIVAE